MKRFRIAAILAFSLTTSASVVHTETITLKNGTVLKGSIVQMSELDVTIDTADMGQVLVKRRTILSINDNVQITEVPTALPATAASPVQLGSQVSINNNNNNNLNNTPATVTSTSVPPAASNPAAVASIAAAPLDSATMLSGSIAAGYGAINFFPGKAESETFTGPAVHWDILNYRFQDGLSIGLVGDGIKSLKRKNGDSDNYLLAGGTIGWKSSPPKLGSSVGVFSAGLTIALAQLNSEREIIRRRFSFSNGSNDSNGYDVKLFDEKSISKSYQGQAAGVNLSYAYFLSGGAGLQIGMNVQQAWLKDVKENCPHDQLYEYGGGVTYTGCQQDPITLRSAQAYAGLGYRF